MNFSVKDWLEINFSEGMGNKTFAGYLYKEAFARLENGYSAIAFRIAVASFKEGSESNAAGLYNTYPLRRTNQVVSLLNQYFVKQRQ